MKKKKHSENPRSFLSIFQSSPWFTWKSVYHFLLSHMYCYFALTAESCTFLKTVTLAGKCQEIDPCNSQVTRLHETSLGFLRLPSLFQGLRLVPALPSAKFTVWHSSVGIWLVTSKKGCTESYFPEIKKYCHQGNICFSSIDEVCIDR